MNGTNWKQNSRHFTGMQTSVGKKAYDPTTGKTAYTFSGIENIGEKTRDAISPMIKDDTERQAFVKQANEAIERRKQNQSSMQALSSLYDANGNAINANTADLSLMVQGIRSIADSGKRAEAADALETLTKTQGSRFYGQTIDKTLAKTYLSSPDFGEKDYKEFVSCLDGAFWPQSGHEAENRETYQGFLEDIESSGYDERITRQLRAALDEAYQNATGAAYAGDEPVEQTQTEQTPGEAAAQEQPDGEEKQTGLLEGIFGALTETAQPYGFRGDSDKDAEDGAQEDGVDALTSASAKREANPQEQVNPGFLDTLTNAMQGKLVDDSYFKQRQGGANEQTPEEAAEDAQETGPLGYTKTGTVASATASDVLPPLPGYTPKEKAEVQGPQQREYRAIESDADVVAAYLGGWYDEIAPQDRETFERWMNSTSAKAVLGVVSDEREINLALSDNGAPELTLMEGTGVGALGMTAYAAREMILGEDFPQELKSYGLTMLTMLGARADQYAQEGKLGGDAGLPNLERLLQTDEESREQLDAIYAARDELTRNMQDARREHEEASAKSLADARAAVLSGQYSDEQLLLVQENAPEAGWKEITADQTRAQMAAQVEFIDEGYFAPGGGFEQSAVRAGLDASGVVSDDNYRLALADKMTVILNEDTQTALSLGLSLEEYYSRVGGMDMDTLCQRAATRMSREGEGMTQEDAQAQSYGSGMGGAVIAAYGITRGVKYFYGSYADSLYMGMTEADVTRTAARMAMQYQQDYGLLAGTQYKKDLQALIDSGDLTEEYGRMIASMMEEADNIFAIGIDPGAHTVLRGVGSEARRSIRAMDKQVATYGTESENRWYYRASGMTSNLLQAGAASLGTKLTGSSNIGFLLGYDVMGYGERFNARLAEGYKRGSASYLAAIDTAGSHLANVGTFEGIYGRMTGTGSLHTAAAADLLSGDPSGMVKGLSAIKRYAWAGIKGFAASEFDEAVVDELKEGLAQEVIDKTIAPLFTKLDAGEQIGAGDLIASMLNIGSVNVAGVAGDVIGGAKEVLITNSLFALAGAAGDVRSEYKSVQAAKDVVSGKSGDVGAAIDAFNEDAQDPEFIRELDEAAAKAQRDERTAQILATDDGSDGLLGKQQAAQEQADSHMAHAENSRAAMDEARAVIEEKQPIIDRGEADDTDVQMVVDAQESYAKNKNNDEEATREAAQKQQEADEAAQERLARARAQAAKEQREAAAKLREKLQSDADAARAARKQQIDEAQKRLIEAQDAFERAGENDADLDELDQLSYEMGVRQQALDELTERSTEEEAALQAAYDKASAEIERQQAEEDAAWADYQKAEKLREERERLSGVKRELRQKRILLDDAQAAEIKNMTGARSLSAANKILGTRFTRSRGNSDVTLDGSYYQELAAMSGGSLDPDSLHPETDIVNLLGQMKEMWRENTTQASLGETDVLPSVSEDASYGTQDPVTQELASLLYKKTGIELVVAKLADGVRAIYDRQNGRMLVSTRVGIGEQMRMAVLHELTHFIEKAIGYEAYRDSILAAAYDGDTDAMQKDMDDLVSKYEAYGIDLTAENAQRELVAKATERLIGDKDGTLTQQLLDEGYRGTVARIYSKLTSFLARRKAKRAGEAALRQYNMLEDAKKRLREALEARGKWQKGQESGVDPTVEIDAAKRARGEVETDSEQTQMQFSLSQDENGETWYDYSRPFAQQVQDFVDGKIRQGDTLLLGKTPDVLKEIGFSNLPLTIDQKHMRYVLGKPKNEDHDLGVDFMKKLPELIADPVAVIENSGSPESGVIVILAQKNENAGGKQIIGAVNVSSGGSFNGISVEATRLQTVHSRGDIDQRIANAVKKEKDGEVGVYYVNKEAIATLESGQSQVLDTLGRYGFLHSILDADSPVKAQKRDQTETSQFRHWFGKSKVVDEDGNPLVVYHGTDAEFDVFEMDRGRANMDIQGAFFSPYEEDAAGYGQNVRGFYLSIKNPADESTAYRALNRFKGQNNAGVKAREYLQSLGYDGVYNGYDEYIAFEPTQIKSATDNVGLFDPKNPNVQYAVGDVGFRMFGNETAQRLDTLTQTVKDALKGTTYEKDTNAEQVDRAQKIIDRDGLSETIDSLLTKSQEEWSADEHALGALCMVLANQPGQVDPIRAMAIAQVYNEAGTKAGKALQVRQIVGKLTPSGAMLGAVKNAKDANEKKGIGGNAIPMGNEAPKGKNRKRVGKSGTTIAPMGDVQAMRGPEGDAVQGSFTQEHPAQIVEKIYDRADRTYADLSTLPQDVSRDNPWNLPLNPAQMALIRQYGLMGEKLPGASYSRASQTQRMLAAIISTPNNVRGDGLLTLCQQLEAMKQGLAVVTEADLSYIAGQASEVLAQGVTEAGTPATVEGRIAMARMYDTQANTVPATFGQKFNAIRYDNMLSAAATWVRNVASNVLVAPLEKASTWLASAADAAVAKQTGTRTTAYTTKEERAAGRDAAAQEVVNTVRDYFVTHADTAHGRKYDTGNRGRTFQSAWLDAYDNIVGFAMQIGDRPFYEACYAEELAVIKRLGMKKQEMDGEGRTYMRDMTAEEMHDEATMRALERVFQEDSSIVKFLNGAEGKEKFLLDTILPFRKTPMNIAKRMFQYSPYGLAKALLVDGLYEAKVGHSFDQRKFVMGVGRGLTGTGMMAAGYILGAVGLLGSGRGDEEDDRMRAMRTAQGEPYSMYLKLGDKDVEIEWGLPSTAGLVIGAKLAELVKDAIADGTFDENDLINVIIGTFTDSAELLFDNTYLSALSDLFRGYGDAGKIIENLFTTTVENVTNQTLSPAFIRALAKAIDPYVRDTSSDNVVMEMLNSCVIQYWPGLRQMLPIKTDITGDKVLQSGYYSWGKEHQNAVLHFMNTFLTPTMPIGEKNDAAILELVDLSYRSGETGFLPGYLVTSGGKLRINKKEADTWNLGKQAIELNLNAEETRRANELYGNILFNGTQGVKYPKAKYGNYAANEVEGLRAMMESRDWERWSDEKRIEEVVKVMEKAKEIVAVQMARGQMQ